MNEAATMLGSTETAIAFVLSNLTGTDWVVGRGMLRDVRDNTADLVICTDTGAPNPYFFACYTDEDDGPEHWKLFGPGDLQIAEGSSVLAIISGDGIADLLINRPDEDGLVKWMRDHPSAGKKSWSFSFWRFTFTVSW